MCVCVWGGGGGGGGGELIVPAFPTAERSANLQENGRGHKMVVGI